jgi:putative transposase
LNELRLAQITATKFREKTTGKDDCFALREIQIDEQMTDVATNVHIELNDELIPLRLSRISLLLCIDVDTDCYLGYHLAYSRQPNQQDMLSLLKNVLYPWKPMNITTPSLNYVEGSGFPSGEPFNHHNMTFNSVTLDNALIHLATSVRKAICEDLGSMLSMGIPGRPKRRNWIELAFQTVNKLNHRFPSTTGSHTQDPKKESLKNSGIIPNVSLRTLEEALSIMLTRHNVMPQARLGNSCPIDLFHRHMQTQFLRRMPFVLNHQWNPLKDEKICPVKFSKNGSRAPHINFYQVEYKGIALNKSELINKSVKVEFDRTDIRILKISDTNGNPLGFIKAADSWMRFPHSLHTRQYILKCIRKNYFHGKDPLAEYFQYVLSRRNLPKYALALTNIVNEFNSSTKTPPFHESSPENVSERDNKIIKISSGPCPEWSVDWVNQNENK